MDISKDRRSQKIAVIYPYLMGCLTVGIVFLLVCLFVGYRIGPKNISNLFSQVFPVAKYKKVLYLPKDVLEELTQLNAVIENAGNPRVRNTSTRTSGEDIPVWARLFTVASDNPCLPDMM